MCCVPIKTLFLQMCWNDLWLFSSFWRLYTERGCSWRLSAVWRLLCTCNNQLNPLCAVFTVSALYSVRGGWGGPRLSTDAFLCVQQNWSWFKMWGHAEENKWEHSFHSDGLLHSSTLDIPGCRVTYLWVRVDVDDDRKVEKWNVISNYNNRVDSTKDKVRFKRN